MKLIPLLGLTAMLWVISLDCRAQTCFTQELNHSGIYSQVSAENESTACELIAAVDAKLGGTSNFRILNYDLYPLVTFTDEQQGLDHALAQAKASNTGSEAYLAFYNAHSSSAAYYEIEIKLPSTGNYFSTLGDLERAAIVGNVSDYYYELLSDEEVGEAYEYVLIRTMERLIRLIQDGIDEAEILASAGFYELLQGSYASLSATSIQTPYYENNNLVKDYSGLATQGQALGESARSAWTTLPTSGFGPTPLLVLTSNISTEANDFFKGAASTAFYSTAEKVSVWLHFKFAADGSYRIYYQTQSNFTKQEALDLIDDYFATEMAGYSPG